MNENPTKINNIIIVGGGLAGLTAALMLAEHGHQSMLIDEYHPQVSESIRTTTLNPFAYENLSRLGIIAQMPTLPTPLYSIEVSDQRLKPRRSFTVEDRLLGWNMENTETPLAYTARNQHLVDALLACIAKTPLINHHRGLRIKDFACHHPDHGHAAALLTDISCSTYSCRLVIACDGGGSPLREMAKIRTIRRIPKQTAIVADIKLARPHQHKAWQRFLDGGPLALMPLDDPHTASLVWSLPADEAERLMKTDNEHFNTEINDVAISPYGDLAVASSRHAWPLKLNHAIRPRTDRLVLIGDAAHTIHPLAGQGFNLAMGDISALISSLNWASQHGSDPGSAPVLARYTRKRFAEVATMTLATDGLNFLFCKAPPPLRAIAAMSMSVLDRSPLKQLAMRFAGGQFSHRG